MEHHGPHDRHAAPGGKTMTMTMTTMTMSTATITSTMRSRPCARLWTCSCHSHGLNADAVTMRMMIAMVLNLSFVAIEITFGFVSNSVALIADAGHNFGTCSDSYAPVPPSILAAGRRAGSSPMDWALLGACRPGERRAPVGGLRCDRMGSRGTHRIAASRGWSHRRRVAAVGIVLNGVSAWLLHSGSHDDLNRRSAYLHMLGDAAVSAGVLVSGGIILFTAGAGSTRRSVC